jgi:DNA topoisomerase III
MGKALIIAEKPSVAADIARALGGFTKTNDFFESDDFVLSSAVGHLVEIKAPEEFDVKRGKWSFANLPIIPPHFALNPIAKTEDRLKLLTRLIKRKDVDALINACDAGREGELIFRLIQQHAKAKQPVQRLWLQSMTQQSIKDGFAKLRTDKSMLPLADAARCRSEADWLVGINGTRAMTAFNSRDGGFYLTTVGRVQTPTLAVVVEREEKIKRFISRDYFEVKASFAASNGQYDGRWFDLKFKKDEADPELKAERLWDKATAEQIAAECLGQPAKAVDESKPSNQMAPALFDLTSLQREANGRFGFSAKTTLSIAQALYERHKVLTYPRTDSRALPEDYVETVKQTLVELEDAPDYGLFARKIGTSNWVNPKNKRVFDNSKISDHFAIIPTLQAPKNLSEAEQKVYDMVVKRFLSIFYPAAEYLVTTRITTVKTHLFKTEGRVLVNPGWLAIYGKEAVEGDDTALIALPANEVLKTAAAQALGLVTKPPARYSEATLLSAMEGAGKTIEEDELREAMAGKGLGTPATRAAIIEGLIAENYLYREGREIIPTAKGFQLLTLLRGLGVLELTLPALTGEWEFKLALMEKGLLDRDTFMQEIGAMTQKIVERAKTYEADTVPGDYATLVAPCPKCGQEVRENYRRFACTKCDFSISKTPGSRQFEIPEVETLLTEKLIGPLQGFRSKIGRPFAAILKITGEHKLEFDFGQSNDDEDSDVVYDFSAQQSLGSCPKCSSNVFEHGMSYVCEKSVGAGKSCDFRSGKIILQQPIEPAQMIKLLTEGKTDLLLGFISSRTRRKFKAYLVRGPEGKTSFEFEQRAAKDPAAAKKAGAKKAAASATGADDEAVGKVTKTTAGKKAAVKAIATTAAKAPAKKIASKKTATKASAAKKPATKTVATKSAATKTVTTKTVASKSVAAKKPAAKKPAAKKAAVKKAK